MSLIETLRESKRFLVTVEVMELVRLPRNTVCAMAKSGRLPAVRTGSGYRFDPNALADWLEGRTTGKRGNGGRA